ncbi:MAG: ankyrin repeat domain-containing protein [Chitinophagales bacterium]
MKTLSQITWGLIVLYSLFALFVIIDFARTSSKMDAAGRGMSGGFIIVGVVALIVLIIFNFLPFRLTKIISFFIALVPLISLLSNLRHELSYRIQKNKGSIYFDAKPMQDMAVAIQKGYVETVEELAPQIQSDINQISKNQTTLLHLAVQGRYGTELIDGKLLEGNRMLEMVEILLKNGADPNIHHHYYDPPLVYASDFNSTQLLGLLLQYGANPNTKDNTGVPILCKFIRQNVPQLEEKVALFLENGADPNIEFSNVGWSGTLSLLMMAAEEQQWGVCKLLLEKGANPDFQPSSEYAKTFGQWLEYHQADYAEKGEALPDDFKAFLEWVKNRSE